MEQTLLKELPPEAAPPPKPTEEQIGLWLRGKIAELIGASLETVDVAQPFSFYGLDSVAAVGLAGDLEAFVGRKLPATLTWDYPTIEAVARFLSAGAE